MESGVSSSIVMHASVSRRPDLDDRRVGRMVGAGPVLAADGRVPWLRGAGGLRFRITPPVARRCIRAKRRRHHARRRQAVARKMRPTCPGRVASIWSAYRSTKGTCRRFITHLSAVSRACPLCPASRSSRSLVPRSSSDWGIASSSGRAHLRRLPVSRCAQTPKALALSLPWRRRKARPSRRKREPEILSSIT